LIVALSQLIEENRVAVLDVYINVKLFAQRASAFSLQSLEGSLGAIAATKSQLANARLRKAILHLDASINGSLLASHIEGVEDGSLSRVELVSFRP
jgi:hypothetical protein